MFANRGKLVLSKQGTYKKPAIQKDYLCSKVAEVVLAGLQI